MLVCPVGDISNTRILECIEKYNTNDVKVIFSLEQTVSLKDFERLTKNIKNKEIIQNILRPSVYNNIYNIIQYILRNHSDEYFTIIDIDDSFNECFIPGIVNFSKAMRKNNSRFGRFMGPKLNDKIIDPRSFGYYYSSIFHPSIFKALPPLNFLNMIHCDNFLIGFALGHTRSMYFLPKFLGYEHTKRSTTDSTTVSKERLEDTLYMYCLNSFGYNKECYKIPSLTISIATMPRRVNQFKVCALSVSRFRCVSNGIAKVVVNCASDEQKVKNICEKYGFEFRYVKTDEGSFNKSNLWKTEKEGFVVTLDDDNYYDSFLIENLLKTYILEGRNCVVAGTVRELRNNHYLDCPKVNKTKYGCVSVIGGSGVLYPQNFFTNTSGRNKDIFKTCDDMYFSMIAYKKGFRIITSRYASVNEAIGYDNKSLYARALNDGFKEYSKGLAEVKKSYECYLKNLQK